MQQKALLLAAAVSSPADQPCPARLLLANEHLRYFVDWWIGGVVNKYVSQVTGMISDYHPFLPTHLLNLPDALKFASGFCTSSNAFSTIEYHPHTSIVQRECTGENINLRTLLAI